MNKHINPLRVIAHLMSTNLALLELVEELTSSIDEKNKTTLFRYMVACDSTSNVNSLFIMW